MSISSPSPSERGKLAAFLEETYERFNRREFIEPDPLGVVREYGNSGDREIAALLCSSLAVGRASLISGAARTLLSRFGEHPRAVLETAGFREVRDLASGFRYRFFSGDDLAALLWGAASMIREYGGLGEAFSVFHGEAASSGNCLLKDGRDRQTVLPALDRFARELRLRARDESALLPPLLFPSPSEGSACKRPLLMLRWLVRLDEVDPGGWDPSLSSSLVQPMDTHMAWVAARLGFCSGKSAPNLATALAVTARFREFSPGDPVRYDFALTRPGIRPDLDREAWFSRG